MGWNLHEYPDTASLADTLAGELARSCADGLARDGRAVLVLAGGRTPWPVYARLAQATLDWGRVTVMPTDERCVPHGHDASNLRGLAEAFGAATGIRLAPLTVPEGDPDASEQYARTLLDGLRCRFDAVVLGMGTDGHTASLFPGARRLARGFDPALDACRIDPEPLPPEAPYPRISLSVRRLLRARTLHLLVTGAEKRTVLEAAMADPDPLRRPVAAILHAPGTQVQVHWCPGAAP